MTKKDEKTLSEVAATELPKEVREALEAASPEKGVDWNIVLKVWQAVQQYGPTAVILIKQLISFFQNPTPAPAPEKQAMGSKGAAKGHCDHKDLCLQTLQSAICAACCAAEHYRICCEEETGE